MGKLTSQILFGNVMHARLLPKKNFFSYRIYYISIPIHQLNNLPISYNKPGLISFYDKDHGPRNGSDLQSWINKILISNNVTNVRSVNLICMPRVLGYVFNPVSFWICRNDQGDISAVLCEVNNTFGETHNYLCVLSDKKKTMIKKIFHVSPFLERGGDYEFNFEITDENLKIDINFYNEEKQKQLITYLKGSFEPMEKKSLSKAFWCYPLITLKAIVLIHWQALRLISKGINYIPRPLQSNKTVSKNDL